MYKHVFQVQIIHFFHQTNVIVILLPRYGLRYDDDTSSPHIQTVDDARTFTRWKFLIHGRKAKIMQDSIDLSKSSTQRFHPHTPGRYQKDVSPTVYEGISFFVGVWGSLGYLPRGPVGKIIDPQVLSYVGDPP